jgi:2-succinyl-5-enolpyruvyl-6-hydroxy-3-cyclohexene-1-carboxylate synthase
MVINDKNINHLWTSLITEELRRLGADYFCISPGSRSTPLTVAAAQNPRVSTYLCYDERGAAFHALGYARATGKPAVLVCTSGTAAANYLPAVIEAAMDSIPLIVLTSDRPPELRETMTNQTIRQPALYGDYVRWHFDLPCPDVNVSLNALLTTIDQLYFRAISAHPGPVHMNCMFREPLAPTEIPVPGEYLSPIEPWIKHENPFTRVVPAQKSQSEFILNSLVQDAEPLLVIGRLNSQDHIDAVQKWIQSIPWPVYADVTSGFRVNMLPNIVDHMDLLLLSPIMQKKLANTPILHIGGPLVSKRFYQFLQTEHQAPYILCTSNTRRQDPAHHVTDHIEIDPNCLATWVPEINSESDLLESLRKASTTVQSLLAQHIPDFSEPNIIRTIMALAPDHCHFFISNSMPIRDADMFGRRQEQMIASNRGASGIDGNLATAIGFSQGMNAPVTAIMGDLALIHDTSSLSQLRAINHPLIILLINNGGGGIFHFLPIAEHDTFERFFATPHAWNFEYLAHQFELVYDQPKTLEGLKAAYHRALNRSENTLVEVITDRQKNHQIHMQIYHNIRTALDAIS